MKNPKDEIYFTQAINANFQGRIIFVADHFIHKKALDTNFYKYL